MSRPRTWIPSGKKCSFKGGLSLAELQRLKEVTQKKGSNADTVANVLSALQQSGVFKRGTPYYGEGSSVSQALGPALEQAWGPGYQGGTAWVGSRATRRDFSMGQAQHGGKWRLRMAGRQPSSAKLWGLPQSGEWRQSCALRLRGLPFGVSQCSPSWYGRGQ